MINTTKNAPSPQIAGQAADNSPPPTKSHVPLLLMGIAIMLVGSIFPWIFADSTGKAHHGIAMCLFWAMSAAIVRGVGFIPQHIVPRVLLSGWAAIVGILAAAALRFF